MANEDKSTRYHRSRRRAGATSAAVGAGYLGLALLGGGSVAVRDAVVGADGTAGLVAALGYGVVMTACFELLRLPTAYYADVTLERRYGLSVNPEARWWRDHVSHSATTVVAAGCLAALVSGLLSWAPDAAWVLTAVALTLAVCMAAHLAPWLMRPAAGDAEPRVRPDLADRLHALADRCGVPVAAMAVECVSPRTRKASATLVGLSRSRRILLSDTLLAEHGDDEVEVIVAHELAHAVHHDVATSLFFKGLVIASQCYVADRALAALAGPLGLMGKGDLAVLPLAVLAAGAVSAVCRAPSNLLSQFQERRADRFAVSVTGNSAALVKALRHLGALNLADQRPSSLLDRFLHTHPSVATRIAAAQEPARAGAERP